MHVNFPTDYLVEYPKKNINYYDKYGQKNLAPILLEASNFYCMYCGKSLKKDTDIVYQMEHSVDKDGNIDQKKGEVTFLTHCKFNLSIACVTCNIECKKKVEKVSFNKIPHSIDCRHKTCSERCDEYNSLRNQYLMKNAIILQPEGVYKDGKKYCIDYNLIMQVFEPQNCKDDWDVYFFICNHISRFRLNSERYSEEFINRAADVVNYYNRGITEKEALLTTLREINNENVLGVLFFEWFEKIMTVNSIEEVVKICELIVIASALP